MIDRPLKLGFAFCGSFCTHDAALTVLSNLAQSGKYTITPIFSYNTASINTRFGRAADLIEKAEALCGNKAILTIKDAEPLGPIDPLDVLVICPCTGNTLAKLACAITDTPVCMAAKAHLRGDRPLVIALATNDALSANLRNIGTLLQRKHIYFVPIRQDNPVKKPHSLIVDFSLVPDAIEAALEDRQLRPLFL